MSFSVKKGVKQPPSLVNIFRELEDDLGISPPDHGYLMKWAEEGVLLLNTCLTVREHQANSPQRKGMGDFTDRVTSCSTNGRRRSCSSCGEQTPNQKRS